MHRRHLLVLAVVGVAAAAVVGLSAAATMSARDSTPEPAKASDSTKPAAKGVDATPGLGSSKNSQTADEIRSYWTKERMRDAKPMAKTVPGGSTESAPAPSGHVVAPGTSQSTPAKKPTQRKTSRAKSSPGLTSGPGGSGGNAADYWTKDKMDDAQPIEQTSPGGNGSGGSSGSGGGVAPPAIP